MTMRSANELWNLMGSLVDHGISELHTTRTAKNSPNVVVFTIDHPYCSAMH